MSRVAALLLFVLLFASLSPAPAQAAPQDDALAQASEVFSLINQYRAANGIPELTKNNILMQAAQAHSDYQASIQQITHGGPGGSRPIDRAYAAGYGNGAIVFVSELIVGGTNRTPQDALTWWQNSSEHNYYLLSADYLELGVGVASDQDGWVYYTAELGQVAGGTTYTPEEGDTAGAEAAEAVPIMIPVVKAEPRENGALVHIVRTGQALWTISAVYDVPLETIYELNNLNAYSFIFPGDEIILKTADPPTPTPLPETPSATSQPTRTVTPTPGELASAQSDASNPPPASQPAAVDPEAENATTRLVVMLALGSILAVILASFFIQNRPAPEEPTSEDDPFAPFE